jgi:hypothetical protein
MRLSERGAVNVVMVCAVVFGLGLAASAFLNVVQAQRASDERTQLKGQVTDLTYQVAQDRKNAASPTPQPSSSPTPTPSVSPVASGSKSVAFAELGVSVTASDPVADLTYASQPKNGVAIVGLTTASLVSKYPKCVPSFLGQISKHPVGVVPSSNENLIKTIGGNSYYYIKPIVECATDTAGKTLRANLVDAIQSTLLPTLN